MENPFRGVTPRHVGMLAFKSGREFADDQCTQMAAAISYYVLFSLFPLMILAVGITGIFLQDSSFQDDLIEFLQDTLPLDSDGEADIAKRVEAVAGVGGGALGLFGLVGMGWAGSAMFSIIRRSLNRAFDLEGRRPFIRQKLVDFGMMAVLGSLFLLSISATAILRATRAYATDIPLLGELSDELGFAWSLASFMVPVLVSFLAFFLLYWLVPSTHVRRHEAFVGAAVASLLFECAKVGFAIYVENFSNFNVVYAGLGGVVAFLFWVFVSANVLLLGAEVASEYPRVMGGEYDSPRTRVPTVHTLTPWSIRIRRGAVSTLKALVVMRPGRDRLR